MIWGQMKTLAGQFVHKNAFNFDALQFILCDELVWKLTVQDNQNAALLALHMDDITTLNTTVLPDDYGAVLSVSQGGGLFDPVPLPVLYAGHAASDRSYAISGGQIFTPSSGELLMAYAKRIVPAATDADSNIILDKYSNVYLFGLLTLAGIQLEDDEMIAKYSGKYEDALGMANRAYLDAAYGGGLSSMHVPGGPV